MLDVSQKNEDNLKKKLEAAEKRFEFRDVTKTDVFQAKASLAEAISKRIEAENNLDISISDFKNLVGRDPNINWYENQDKKITSSNPKDWSKFGEIPKIPNSLNQSIDIGLANNPEYNQLKIELDKEKQVFGFIKKSNLSNDKNENKIERFALEENIDSIILSVDSKSRTLNLSIKELEIRDEKEALSKYGSSASGASLGDILGSVLKK